MPERYKAVFVDWEGTLSTSGFWDLLKGDVDNVEMYEQLETSLSERLWPEISKPWMLGRM